MKPTMFAFAATLALTLSIAPASSQSEPNPSRLQPLSAVFNLPPSTAGIELYNRFVAADLNLPLPAAGGFYVFTSDALTPKIAQQLNSKGAHLLGVVGQRCYAFEARGSEAVMREGLMESGIVTATALAERADRVLPEVAPFLDSDGPLPFAITACFWEFATANEVRDLLGEAASSMRLPTDGPIFEERFATFATDAAGLRTLAETPLIGNIGFARGGVPLNRAAATINRANLIEQGTGYGLTGSNVTLAQWDNGDCDDAHSDFGGRIQKVTTSTPIGPTGGNFEHATHVAGTMIGAGAIDPSARGMASGANIKFYTFSTSSVPSQRRSAKHNYYIEWDNHSWRGTGTNWGLYNSRAQEYDTDCRDLNMMGVQASGDSADSGQISVNWGGQTRLFDSLAEEASAKNMLVVGGHDDAGTDRYVYSSRGPTNDGRLKPDVCTNGVGLYSCSWNQGGPANTYITLSGTSMSAPTATSILAQLSQLYRQQNAGMRLPPDVAKVALVHTARDRINPAIPAGGSSGNLDNPGPDFMWGYGVVDAKAAADLLLADKAAPGKRIVRGGLRNGEILTFTCTVGAADSELRVSLAWIDSTSGGTATKQLVNDLDLEVLDPSNTQRFPWTLNAAQPHIAAAQTARNGVDNVEQVLVASPTPGTWTIRVRGFSINDVSNPVQGFAMATSHALNNNAIRVVNTQSLGGVALSSTPTDLSFAVSGSGSVGAARVYLDVLANSRGAISATLIHPDSTQVVLKQVDSQTRQDLFAIFPDTKTPVGNMSALAGKAVSGNWILRLSGAGGDIVRLAALEIDSNAPGGGGPTPPAVTTSSLPSGTVGVAYNTSLAASGGTAPYSWNWSGSTPPGLTCSASGVISGMPTTAGSSNFTVTVTDAASQNAQRTLSITINPAAPTTLKINTSALPTGTAGTPYSALLSASGGTAPYSWSWSGNVPPGLNCGSSGAISGTPSLAGSYSVLVVITDAASQQAQRTLALSIINGGGPTPPIITTGGLSSGQVGAAYSEMLSASGGTPGYTWSWGPDSGSILPPGLNCDAAGNITGTPTLAGSFNVIVTVTDNASLSAQAQMVLTIAPASSGGPGGGATIGSGGGGGGCSAQAGGSAAMVLALLVLATITVRWRKRASARVEKRSQPRERKVLAAGTILSVMPDATRRHARELARR